MEIDIESLRVEAAELDALAAAERSTLVMTKGKTIADKPKPKTKAGVITEIKTVEVIPPDPYFEMMVATTARQGIDFIQDKMHLIDPGDEMKVNVGKCLARLASNIMRVQGPVADGVIVVGYLAPWILFGKRREVIEGVKS